MHPAINRHDELIREPQLRAPLRRRAPDTAVEPSGELTGRRNPHAAPPSRRGRS